MKTFFEHFFKYYPDQSGIPGPYTDGLGAGAFSDIRHYLWMVLVIAVCITCYQLFKRKPKLGKTVLLVLVIYLFVVRFTNQVFRASIGAEVPAWRAFPFHLCTTMTFVMPLVVVFNWKPLKTPVYILSMMGGIVTVLMGDYFDNQFLAFASFEGMIAHTILILVPIIDIAIGNFSLDLKNLWQVFVGLGVMILWGTIANEVFFKAFDPNYMYLRKNGLPGNFGGDWYLLVYAGILVLLLSLIYGIPLLYRFLSKKTLKHKAS